METRVEVTVNGSSITDRLSAVLQAVTIDDKSGTSSDTASITLDNRESQIRLPPPGAKISITFVVDGRAAQLFEGTVDDLKSSGSRSAGRVITITAKGYDTSSGAKEPISMTLINETVEGALKRVGAKAGVGRILVDKDLAGIVRPHEVLDHESFAAFGERLADEIGGTFKLRNDSAVMAKRGAGRDPAGNPLPEVSAIWGVNMPSYDLSPFVGRYRFSKIEVRYHDRAAGTWKVHTVKTDLQGATAKSVGRFTAPDLETAKQMAEALKTQAEKESGVGRVVIDGNIAATCEGTVAVTGAGPIEDGRYRIDGVTHRYSRGSGYTTAIEMAFPLAPNATLGG